MKSATQVITDTRKGFRRTAKRTPDKYRRALLVSICIVTTILPVIGLAVAAGGGAGAAAAYFWGLDPEHPAVAVVIALTIAFTVMLLMPLIKGSWRKMDGWDQGIVLNKHWEDQ